MDGNIRPPFLSGQESTIRTGHGKMDWFQIGKGVAKALYGHPAYLFTCRVHHVKYQDG